MTSQNENPAFLPTKTEVYTVAYPIVPAPNQHDLSLEPNPASIMAR